MAWSALLFTSFLTVTFGDTYLQYPPGANNRLDEQNRERNNANRMHDSENNNRGGYNVGKTSFYVGEKVPIMWTNQHGSSKYQMEHTEFVIQYMCDPLLRDGTTTNTIPEKQIDCQNFDCDTDVRFGRHESYDYYQMCKRTERNKGLFTINQNLKGQTAQYTRQNAAGTRHGYECPEERDYYPYWRPSPWVDIAYITNDVSRCEEVELYSQNVKERYECRLADAFYDLENYPQYLGNKNYPINEEDCADFEIDVTLTDEDDPNVSTTQKFNATWTMVPAHGVAKPDCVQTEQTRANHLGVVGGRTQFSYEWEIPADLAFSDRCALRLRYNITTNDYEAWDTNANLAAGANSTVNTKKQNPNPGNDPAELDMWSKFGLEDSDVKNANGQFKNDQDSREYILKNNPQVEIIRQANGQAYQDDGNQDFRFKLQLAVNTAQFGRTFQDRTHGFSINERPADVPADANIVLQSVSGKRGNIVQTFPAHEYFFIPEVNNLEKDDYVHFMWTGSNTNPDNNDGQGKQGTDRSNIVPLRVQKYSKDSYSDFTWDASWSGANSEPLGGDGETGDAGNSYPAYIQQPEGYEIPDAAYGKTSRDLDDADITLADNLIEGAFGGLSTETLAMLATSRQAPLTDFGNMEELDDASTSVNLPPQQVSAMGCWNYVSTRNNNFSNRSQKGKLCVLDGSVNVKMVGQNGAEIWSNHGDYLMIWPNTMNGVSNIRFESRQTEDSDVATVANVPLMSETKMTLGIRYSPQALKKPVALHRAPGEDDWEELDDVEFTTVNDQHVAVINHDEEGEYKVGHQGNVGAMVGIIFGVIFFVCGILYVMYSRYTTNKSEV